MPMSESYVARFNSRDPLAKVYFEDKDDQRGQQIRKRRRRVSKAQLRAKYHSSLQGKVPPPSNDFSELFR